MVSVGARHMCTSLLRLSHLLTLSLLPRCRQAIRAIPEAHRHKLIPRLSSG